MKAKAESFRVLRLPKYLSSQTPGGESTEQSSENVMEPPNSGFQILRKMEAERYPDLGYRLQLNPIRTKKDISSERPLQKSESMLVPTRANTLDSTSIDEALHEKPNAHHTPKKYFKITKNLTLNHLDNLSSSKKQLYLKVPQIQSQPSTMENLPSLSARKLLSNPLTLSHSSSASHNFLRAHTSGLEPLHQSKSSHPLVSFDVNSQIRSLPSLPMNFLAAQSSQNLALSSHTPLHLPASILASLPLPSNPPSPMHDYFLHGLYQHHTKQKLDCQVYGTHVKDMHRLLRDVRDDAVGGKNKGFGGGNLFEVGKNSRPLAVLDLDETLIHCCNKEEKETDQNQSYTVRFCSDSGTIKTAKVLVRPHLKEFLSSISEYYDVVIYTASEREYAHAVVRLIDPSRKYIKQIYHRDHCVVTKKGYIVKDLKILAGDHLQKVVLVDNSAHCFALQITNNNSLH
jgi:Dullard-like phosphatase family protein